MPRTAYVNGRYLPYADASVHIDDRGYTFADGVYEVVLIVDGRFVDEEPHLNRLERSLREMRMTAPMSRRALSLVLRETARRNRVRNGLLYLQMTRGVAPRDHFFPTAPRTQIVIWAKTTAPQSAKVREEGVKVITTPDIRWGRCDIKSTSLLPNVLAKQAAREAGAYEAWLVDRDGFVTEGASSNAWIVTRDGELVTRALDAAILGGVTRLSVLELAQAEGLKVVQRPFRVEDAQGAREAFLTSASSFVLPVTAIDDRTVANGRPGSLTTRLRALYDRRAEMKAD